MKDPTKLKELILRTVDLAGVMLDYGVQFAFNPKHAIEVQFRCPFHGKDQKPSARLYRNTQSCYCWFCKKKWDVVSFVQDKEGFSFINALKFIMERYHVDTSSIPDDPEIKLDPPPKVSDDDIRLISIRRRLQELRGVIALERYRMLAYTYQMIGFYRSRDVDVSETIKKLEIKCKTSEESPHLCT